MPATIQKIVATLIGAVITCASFAQSNATFRKANNRLNDNQKNFNRLLGRTNMDRNGKAILLRFITVETDSLQKVNDKSDLSPVDKILAINTLDKFLDTLQTEINNKQYDVNYTRLYIDRFKQLWQAMANKQNIDEVMKPFKARVSSLLSGVFSGYPGADRIKSLAVLKDLESSPEKITGFLSNNNTFPLLDSLIFISGNSRPELLINFYNGTRDEVLRKAINEHKSPIIQTLVSLAGEKELKTYIPFVVQLSKKELTLADIDKTRTQPTTYYQLLVDAEIDNWSKLSGGETPLYAEPTKQYLKTYAIKFYTDIINSLHDESSEAKRYFVLEGLRTQDLYYIITSGETELYTSSYLYIYKKLMSRFSKTNSDSLFKLVNYDQYKKFLLMAGRYNTLSAFMKQMPVDSSIVIIKRMMNHLESNVNNGLEETISIAETFPGIVNDPYLASLITREINNNYIRCRNIPNAYGMKVYSLLQDIYVAVKNTDPADIGKINPALATYFKVKHNTLYEDKGTINQLVLFYGDEDGKSSYASFMTNFSDGAKWTIEKNKSWVNIKSKSLYPVSIYANLPLSEDGSEDIKAQKELLSYLAGQHIESHIMIHRGHSYHLPNSLTYVTPSVKLAILGSCGGYNEIFELLKKSPEAQVISTKQVGSKLVNEPLLKLLNDDMLNQKDLDWAAIWKKLDSQLKSNKNSYEYFQEYVPPYKNISLLTSALYAQSGIE